MPFLRPGPAAALLAFALSAGAFAGVGGYTFFYAKGASYLTDDPRACVNCHVMREQFDGWVKSTHHAVASCNDCHTPHDPLRIAKWSVKALNGWRHSYAFTSGDFPEPIRITALNLRVAEANCRSCHAPVVQAIDGPHEREATDCTACHRGAGHP